MEVRPRRKSGSGNGGPTIQVSVGAWMENLDKKFDSLIALINDKDALVDRRLGLLEQNALIVEKLQTEMAAIRTEFSGFTGRFRDHERDAFHTTGVTALAKLEADVEGLKKAQITSEAVSSFIKQQGDENKVNRRWIIGLVVTVGVTIGLFVAREIVIPWLLRV